MKSTGSENLMPNNYFETDSTVGHTNVAQYDENTIESLRFWLLPLGYAISFIIFCLFILCLGNLHDTNEIYLGFFFFVPFFFLLYYLLRGFATCPINQFASNFNAFKVVFGIFGSVILFFGVCCLFNYVGTCFQGVEVRQ